ncbi:MAG TPA: glutathione S-transferase family protein [Polyangiaceae bacterium]|nr:glutathione S-transferase family protein [Polyangiaceae bacterium]
MTDTISLYTNPFSRGRIAHWMLEEVGAPYHVELLDFERNEHKSPEYLTLNPMGKVPAIVHHGVVVSEAAAICAYLADAFPTAKLAPPPSEPARGTYFRWLFFAAGCIEAAALDKQSPRAAPVRSSALGYGTYEDVMNAIEQAVSPGPFVLGDRFSAADVYLGSQLGWGLMVKSIEPRPAFTEYVARLARRPAYARYMEQSKALEEALKTRQGKA